MSYLYNRRQKYIHRELLKKAGIDPDKEVRKPLTPILKTKSSNQIKTPPKSASTNTSNYQTAYSNYQTPEVNHNNRNVASTAPLIDMTPDMDGYSDFTNCSANESIYDIAYDYSDEKQKLYNNLNTPFTPPLHPSKSHEENKIDNIRPYTVNDIKRNNNNEVKLLRPMTSCVSPTIDILPNGFIGEEKRRKSENDIGVNQPEDFKLNDEVKEQGVEQEKSEEQIEKNENENTELVQTEDNEEKQEEKTPKSENVEVDKTEENIEDNEMKEEETTPENEVNEDITVIKTDEKENKDKYNFTVVNINVDMILDIDKSDENENKEEINTEKEKGNEYKLVILDIENILYEGNENEKPEEEKKEEVEEIVEEEKEEEVKDVIEEMEKPKEDEPKEKKVEEEVKEEPEEVVIVVEKKKKPFTIMTLVENIIYEDKYKKVKPEEPKPEEEEELEPEPKSEEKLESEHEEEEQQQPQKIDTESQADPTNLSMQSSQINVIYNEKDDDNDSVIVESPTHNIIYEKTKLTRIENEINNYINEPSPIENRPSVIRVPPSFLSDGKSSPSQSTLSESSSAYTPQTEEYTKSDSDDYSTDSSSSYDSEEIYPTLIGYGYFPQYITSYITPYQACNLVVAESDVIPKPSSARANLEGEPLNYAEKLREDVNRSRENENVNIGRNQQLPTVTPYSPYPIVAPTFNMHLPPAHLNLEKPKVQSEKRLSTFANDRRRSSYI